MDVIMEFKKFVNSIDKDTKYGIVAHNDGDGICSAVIASKSMERLSGKKPTTVLMFNYGQSQDALINEIITSNVKKLIILDLAIEQEKGLLTSLKKYCDIMILDHHRYEKVPKNILCIKADMLRPDLDPVQYCVSKMSFDLFSRLLNVEDLIWVSCLGLISDVNYRTWKDFVNQSLESFKYKVTEDIMDSKFGKIVSLIGYGNAAGKSKEIYKKVYSSKDPKDLEMKLADYKKIGKEVEKLENNFEKNAEFYNDLNLAFYDLSSKHNVKSIVLTSLSMKYPDKTIIGYNFSHGRCNISARRQDYKVSMEALVKAGIKKLVNSMAGGHIPAAGAKVKDGDLDKFKKNVIDYLKNYLLNKI